MARAALDSPGDTLTAVEAALVAKRTAEADILRAAVAWADQHPAETVGSFGYTPRGAERAIRIGGEGTPLVQEFCHAELAISLELHPLGARALMADALDLHHRLPSLWTFATVDLSLPEWVARKIARATRELSGAQVAEVDRRLAQVAATLPTGRLLGLVEAMVVAARDEHADRERRRRLSARFVTISDGRHRTGQRELPTIYGSLDEADSVRLDEMLTRLAGVLADQGDPDPIDVRRSKALGLLADPARALARLTGEDEGESSAPPVVLHLHLTESAFRRDEGGVARFEQGGPITLAHAREILGHSRVTIRPVLDLEHQRPADAYEFTGSLREAVLARTPADCYPYAVKVGRSMDLDHTTAFYPHGPPGQTCAANAGPLTRHHHRIKTHGPIAVRQPRPGLYVWRTQHGRYLATDHRGTRRLAPSLASGIYAESAVERRVATILVDLDFD